MINIFGKGDHFFGCSLQAAYDEVSKFGYRLYTLIYNNAIFISDDIKINVPDRTLTQIYNDGYVNKPDRKEKFSYNYDVDVLLKINPSDSIEFINNLFKDYQGKYQLELGD